jgi:hypothetical protein
MAVVNSPKDFVEPKLFKVEYDKVEARLKKSLKKDKWDIELLSCRKAFIPVHKYPRPFRVYKLSNNATEFFLKVTYGVRYGGTYPPKSANSKMADRMLDFSLFADLKKVPLRRTKAKQKESHFVPGTGIGYYRSISISNMVEAINARLESGLMRDVEDIVLDALRATPGLKVEKKHSGASCHSVVLDLEDIDDDVYVSTLDIHIKNNNVELERGYEVNGPIKLPMGDPHIGESVKQALIDRAVTGWAKEIRTAERGMRAVKQLETKGKDDGSQN